MKIINPATEETVTDVDEDKPATVTDKYARARRAQPSWARVSLSDRIAAVRRFRDLLATHKADLALTLTREMGKPVKQAHNELGAMPGRIDFFLQHTAAVLSDEVVLTEGTGRCPSSRRPSATSRWVWWPTSRPGTTPTSSARTCSCRRCSPATPSFTSPPSTPP
jgi:acyl-CoA reductase-like NAD-dependent aldehyde dehydrogenase